MKTTKDHVIQIVRRLDSLRAEQQVLDDELTRLLNIDESGDAIDKQKPPRGKITEKLLTLLSENPRIDHERLAVAMYGVSNEKTRNRLRSNLHGLKNKKKRIRQHEDGSWEVLPRPK